MMSCSQHQSQYDQCGCIVKTPQLEDVDQAVQGMETRPAPKQNTVDDSAGMVFGHVPRNICNVLATGFTVDFTMIARAVCIFTGEFLHGGPVPRDGPKLLAVYHLEIVRPRDASKTAEDLRPLLDNPDRL